jgi:pseudouridine kinase
MKKVYVIGGAVIDVFLYPHQKMILKDSNPGYVVESMGGVGRNIAENLARLGQDVTLLTTLGKDNYAHQIKEHAKACNLKLDIILSKETPRYYAVIDENRDDVIGIAAMDQINSITQAEIEKRMDQIMEADIVVLDTNISTEALKYAFDHIKKPIFVDAISTQKAVKLKPFYSKIFMLKLNEFEAETLTGIKYQSYDDLNLMGDIFNQLGVSHVLITLGKIGAYYANKDFGVFRNGLHVEIKNPTGAGDAFLSGAIYAYLNQLSILEVAMANAVLNLRCMEAVCQHLNEEKLINILKETY